MFRLHERKKVSSNNKTNPVSVVDLASTATTRYREDHIMPTDMSEEAEGSDPPVGDPELIM
jgi:hypothetical protein